MQDRRGKVIGQQTGFPNTDKLLHDFSHRCETLTGLGDEYLCLR
jgi:hypothetical protein